MDHPYAGYADLDIEYMTPDRLTGEVRGDVYDRIVVRLLEVKQSIALVRQLLEQMPDGPLLAIPKPAVLLAKLKAGPAKPWAATEPRAAKSCRVYCSPGSRQG